MTLLWRIDWSWDNRLQESLLIELCIFKISVNLFRNAGPQWQPQLWNHSYLQPHFINCVRNPKRSCEIDEQCWKTIGISKKFLNYNGQNSAQNQSRDESEGFLASLCHAAPQSFMVSVLSTQHTALYMSSWRRGSDVNTEHCAVFTVHTTVSVLTETWLNYENKNSIFLP